MLSPPLDDDILLQSFSVSLMVYSKVKKVSLRGKTMSKEEKSMKMKELLFALDDSNYTEFLQVILHKHSLDDYIVTKKKHFPLKYIPLKVKGQWMSDTIDVNDIANYREMVKKIAEETPPVVKVFVDMQHVDKLAVGVRQPVCCSIATTLHKQIVHTYSFHSTVVFT
ncbi:hypothetical protein PISMIDRAFT_121225 [Pisolithus microcarpus 441]|uniref:Uncharacterized protein n=1 Tax=Pisolithus microcarpus 441 TaxID=765257 RepID=A0A0C9XIS7_9AGAM|nr:hypothetical protein BKA83DRAFT_121225 [Pisolithus microcarpus]KIK12235.1 hypothetical protein PISMIDRAFT_121225 [Pisolithus microcarpus 441]